MLECMERIQETGPVGGYYEFGLYRGETFRFAFRAAEVLELDWMRFYGFDSFEGLPKPEGIDAGAEFHSGDYKCKRPEVEGFLGKCGVDMSRVDLIEGFYSESLRPELVDELNMQPVSLVLIDCDLYISASQALRFLGPLLQEGSILMFDDWGNFGASDERGERRAFREFLEENPHLQAEPYIDFGQPDFWHGQSFIMHVEEDPS
jgi:hypothetical protein